LLRILSDSSEQPRSLLGKDTELPELSGEGTERPLGLSGEGTERPLGLSGEGIGRPPELSGEGIG